MFGEREPSSPSRRARLVGVAAAVVACALGLVGCTGEAGKPSPASTVQQPTASAEPTPTQPSPPPLPAAVSVKNKAGAEAAFRYFLETYTYAYAAGDPTAFRSIVTGRCKFCSGVMDDVGKMNSVEQKVVGGKIRILVLILREHDSSMTSYLVRAVISQEEQRSVDSQGSVKATFSADPRRAMEAKIQWEDSRWRVDEAAVVEDAKS